MCIYIYVNIVRTALAHRMLCLCMQCSAYALKSMHACMREHAKQGCLHVESMHVCAWKAFMTVHENHACLSIQNYQVCVCWILMCVYVLRTMACSVKSKPKFSTSTMPDKCEDSDSFIDCESIDAYISSIPTFL